MESQSHLSHTDIASSVIPQNTYVKKLYYPRLREGQIKEWKWDEEKQKMCVFVTQVKENVHSQAGSQMTSSDLPTQEFSVGVENLARSTIEVLGLRASYSEDVCRSYFENPSLSGGGQIIHLSTSEDNRIVFITFESWKVAERVACRSHVINKHRVTVNTNTSSHPIYSNTLLLTNVGDHTTEDQVSMYLENITGLEPCEILFGEQPGAVIVMFDEQIDFNLVKSHCETLRLYGHQLSVSKFPVPNCVLVEYVGPGTTEDDLIDYFENVCNIGSLERVEMMPIKNKCLVYFEDSEVVDYVLTQTHTIKGRELSLQHYFQVRVDQICPFNKPKSLYIKNIDQFKLAFVNLSSKVQGELSQQLLALYGEFEIVDNTLTVECTLTSSIPMAYALARTWSHCVQFTINKYMNLLEVYKIKTLSIVWNEAIKSVEEIKEIKPDVAVASLDSQENVIVIVAKSGARNFFQQIFSVAENIEMEMEPPSTKIREKDKRFPLIQLRLLRAFSFSAEVCAQYKYVNTAKCMAEREVTLTGLFQNDKEALVEMVKLHHLVKLCVINDLTSIFRLMLSNSETRMLLEEKFEDAQVTAVWEDKNDSIVVYAFSDKELLKAVRIIRGSVVEHVLRIPLVEHTRQLLDSDEWNAFALKLMKTYSGKLNLSYSQTTINFLITIILTNDILDIVMANVGRFFHYDVFSEEYYIFSPSRQKFVNLFWKDKVAALAASMAESKVQVTLSEDGDGEICAKGTQTGRKLLKDQLQALSDQIICHVTTVDDPLKVKFLTTDKCAKQMDIFERSSQCVLGLSEEPNVIQVLTSINTEVRHTDLDICSTGQETVSRNSGANPETQRKPPATNVSILDGNIAKQQVDVIVNSTNHDLNLNSGGVSASILAEGGQDMQIECRTKYPKGINVKDIARTSGHGLQCKEVFHVALCPFQTQNAQQILGTMVSKCLMEANESRFTSIAFPALGVGVLGYPTDVVSNTMKKAIETFLTSTPAIYTTSIKVVIFNDTEMIQDFQSVFADLGMQTVPTTNIMDHCGRPSQQKVFKAETLWSGFMEYTFGDLRLVIKPGDVTEEDVDAIVNSTNNNFDLNGAVSTTLRTMCGVDFIQECKGKVAEIQDKGVCVTQAFNLKSKVILHINLNKFPTDRLSEGIEALLNEAERYRVSTIAFPAIGLGAGRILTEVLAEAMFQALVNFIKVNMQNVKEVRVVLFDNDAISPFVSEIQQLSKKYRTKKRGIAKLFKGKTHVETSLSSTLHQVARLYIYSTERSNVKRLLDDFGGLVTRKFMRNTTMAMNDPISFFKRRPALTPNLMLDSTSASDDHNLKAVIPSTWKFHGPNEKVKRVLLKPSYDEYQEVVKRFKTSLDMSVKIISVERIQNPTLYTLYSVKKKDIEHQNSDIPGIQNEKTLWHGTTINAIDNINHHGFNRSYCGKNATVYGEGVYFAVNSAYSANIQYSTPDTSGNRYIYQCKVLTGCPTKGDDKMKVLPSRSGLVLYDSATNDMETRNIYVIFNDHQAYPEYLITFRELD